MPDVNEDPEDARMALLRPELDKDIPESLDSLLREAKRRQREIEASKAEPQYPYPDGDLTVLGPEVFTDGTVICHKGVNYVPQEHEQVLRSIRSVAAIHCTALIELLHDAGIRLPESALRIYQLLYDELTLTMPALAERHPAVLPRLPEGMQ